MAHKQAFLNFDEKNNTLVVKGDWVIRNIATIKQQIHDAKIQDDKNIKIEGKEIKRLDSAGVWMIMNGFKHVDLQSFSKQHQKLFEFIKQKQDISNKKEHLPKPLTVVQTIGKYSLRQKSEVFEYINFVGKVTLDSALIIFNPLRWRWNSLVSVINTSGASALPIVTLLSFMIGVVITYQMGNQLQQYGANVFVVDLLGLSILREFGPLLTAIMVGGRTGSAFTAQLGIMKINLEIDALKAMGIKITNLLILPRILALFIVVPLLTIWADIFGIMGGMTMSKNMLGISWYDFLLRFQQEVPIKSLVIGLLKAPVFALIIASVGCFEGMKVHGSAESVGIRTTRSVVIGIFLVIAFDSVVSVLLSEFDL